MRWQSQAAQAAGAIRTSNHPEREATMEIVSDYSAMHRDLVGGKFSSQARMRTLGVAVPDFFCLSRLVFDRMMENCNGRIATAIKRINLQDRATITATAHEIMTLFESIRFDSETEQKIRASLDWILPDTGFVSVRACMLSTHAEHSEDSASNPFAGISETFLYVKRTAIFDRIKQCWASAFSEKALLYRLSQGIDPLDVGVAVGIQRMVFGCRSFVMFTCDPNTAARDTVIAAGYGIGEGVVQEAVPVDHYFINEKNGEIRKVLADKSGQLNFDVARGQGLCRQPVNDELRQHACLSDDELQMLRMLGQKIEHGFGWPQDIEGTIDANGKVFILQARPIAIDYTKKRIWTGLNVTESYPGVSSPLTYSVARLFYRVIFRDVYRRIGVPEDQLRTHHFLLDRMIGYVQGRIYYSLNAFYRLHGLSLLFPWLTKAWENMIGLRTSYQIKSGEKEAVQDTWRHRWALTKAFAQFAWLFVRHPKAMRAYKQWWVGRAQQARTAIRNDKDGLALAEEFYRLWRDVGEKWGITLVNDAYIFTLYALVSGLFKRWKLDKDPALLSNLLCGGSEVESVEIFLSVLRIVDHIRNDRDAYELMSNTDDAQLVLMYQQRLLDGRLLCTLDQHIERYGDRSMEELKMENPSLRDDPIVLFRGIRRFLKSNLDVEACRRAEDGKRAEAEAGLDRHFGRFSVRKAALRWLTHHLREMIAHRENSRYCRSELFGICRDIFRAQGNYLASKKAIDAPQDVVYLTVDEIMGYADGTGVDESFHDTVARRKQQVVIYQSQDVPETLVTDGALRNSVLSSDKAALSGSDKVLHGLGSSMGSATGTARVVLDPNSIEELPSDTILVAKETDPGWLFLMLASSGIVVERGSMLSHTAITGRKFGIPTVVGVDRATSRIPDGAALEINGGSGIVKVLSSEASESSDSEEDDEHASDPVT
jgi:phosphoenolpyruvate synthase/pyruvate phosphate dikinase